MKLTDLNPRWIGDEDKGRHGLGLHFLCPCCRGTRIGVYFKNPIDGGKPIVAKHLWNRVGESFKTLTLTPSINAKKSGHWHGFVTNGEVVDA